MNYNHNDEECFCLYCGLSNNSNTNDMCEYCYDDLSISYFCYLCNSYYNYIDISNVCPIYIEKSNIIKKWFKKYFN